jgi:hypothetical protein
METAYPPRIKVDLPVVCVKGTGPSVFKSKFEPLKK